MTTPIDLQRAGALLDGGLVPGRPAASPRPSLAAAGRIGLGTDSHPFGPASRWLWAACGSRAPRGWPAIRTGTLLFMPWPTPFSAPRVWATWAGSSRPIARTPAGVDSRVLLATVAEKVRSAGWVAANVDLTIVAARPRLARLLPAMGEAIAAALARGGVGGQRQGVHAATWAAPRGPAGPSPPAPLPG